MLNTPVNMFSYFFWGNLVKVFTMVATTKKGSVSTSPTAEYAYKMMEELIEILCALDFNINSLSNDSARIEWLRFLVLRAYRMQSQKNIRLANSSY